MMRVVSRHVIEPIVSNTCHFSRTPVSIPLATQQAGLDCRSWVYNVPVLKSALPLRITESMVWFSGWTLSQRVPLPSSRPS